MSRLSTIEHNKRLQLHSEGKSNYEIGQILGVRQTAINCWVNYHGLKPNKGLRKSKLPTDPVNVAEKPMRERLIVRQFLIELYEQRGGVT